MKYLFSLFFLISSLAWGQTPPAANLISPQGLVSPPGYAYPQGNAYLPGQPYPQGYGYPQGYAYPPSHTYPQGYALPPGYLFSPGYAYPPGYGYAPGYPYVPPQPNGNNFSYQPQDQGWFYYNWELEEDKPLSELPQALPQGKMTLEQLPPVPEQISVAWLRTNLPKYLEFAMDNPSQENVLAYLYLQTYASQQASVFSEQAQLVTQGNAILDNNAVFPQNAVARQYREQLAAQMRRELIRTHAAQLTMIFTISGDYESRNFTALAAKAASNLGIKVQIYEVNAQVYPELAQYWHMTDLKRINEFINSAPIEMVPTVNLFSPTGGVFLVEGATDLQEFEMRIVRYLYKQQFISREQFNLARGIMSERLQDPAKVSEFINRTLLQRE